MRPEVGICLVAILLAAYLCGWWLLSKHKSRKLIAEMQRRWERV